MSGRRKTDGSLMAEARGHRIRLREEQGRHAETRDALRDANRLLLRFALRDHFKYPQDFVVYCDGLNSLLDATGRLDWSRVEAMLRVVLEKRPYLATPSTEVPITLHVDAVSSIPPGSVLDITDDPEQKVQGATRSEPGAGADEEITHPTESP